VAAWEDGGEEIVRVVHIPDPVINSILDPMINSMSLSADEHGDAGRNPV